LEVASEKRRKLNDNMMQLRNSSLKRCDAKKCGFRPTKRYHIDQLRAKNSMIYSNTINNKAEIIDILDSEPSGDEDSQSNDSLDFVAKSSVYNIKNSYHGCVELIGTKKSDNSKLSLKNVCKTSDCYKFASRKKVVAIRIAIGKSIFTASCTLSFQPGGVAQHIFLSYQSNRLLNRCKYDKIDPKAEISPYTHKISLNDISLMKYFIATEKSSLSSLNERDDRKQRLSDSIDDDSDIMNFLTMRISPSADNGLREFRDSYVDDTSFKNGPNVNVEKHYVVVEVLDSDEFYSILDVMKKNLILKPILRNAQLSYGQTPTFTKALVEDNRIEKTKRLNSITSFNMQLHARRRNPYVDDNILLVYPFRCSSHIYYLATKGLTEADGHTCLFIDREQRAVDWIPRSRIEMGMQEDNNICLPDNKRPSKLGRDHYITIGKEDVGRLEPGQFLNDTLIDFWMKWISRKDITIESNFHFFSSYFFTTLMDEGVNAVTSWTAKRNINIFEKKFIFIPINESLHWSLCTIVNPSSVENVNRTEQELLDDEYEIPCILFMDSLNTHKKVRVAKRVREWLNSEAKRLKAFPDLEEEPFVNLTMEIFDPKSKLISFTNRLFIAKFNI